MCWVAVRLDEIPCMEQDLKSKNNTALRAVHCALLRYLLGRGCICLSHEFRSSLDSSDSLRHCVLLGSVLLGSARLSSCSSARAWATDTSYQQGLVHPKPCRQAASPVSPGPEQKRVKVVTSENKLHIETHSVASFSFGALSPYVTLIAPCLPLGAQLISQVADALIRCLPNAHSAQVVSQLRDGPWPCSAPRPPAGPNLDPSSPARHEQCNSSVSAPLSRGCKN